MRNLHCQCGLVKIVFMEYNNMKHIIKDTIIGTTILTAIILFLAMSVIVIYKAAGL